MESVVKAKENNTKIHPQYIVGVGASAGGLGGGNSSTIGCIVNNPGRGGKPLNSWGGTKIFPGGGGGAGPQ